MGWSVIVCSVIARQTPMLEELSGPSKSTCLFLVLCVDRPLVLHMVLSQCIPKLPNLQRLNVYRGEALEGVGKLIRSHCPLFKALQFYGWYEHTTRTLDFHPNLFSGKKMMQTNTSLLSSMIYVLNPWNPLRSSASPESGLKAFWR